MNLGGEERAGEGGFRDKYVVSADSFLGDYEIAAIWIQTEQNFALSKVRQTLKSGTGMCVKEKNRKIDC